MRWQEGGTALMLATEKGHTDCVRLLVDGGADTDVQDQVCCASLLVHCYCCHEL